MRRTKVGEEAWAESDHSGAYVLSDTRRRVLCGNVLSPDVELFCSFYFSVGPGYRKRHMWAWSYAALSPRVYTIYAPKVHLLTSLRVKPRNHFKSVSSRWRILDEEEETEMQHNSITLHTLFLQKSMCFLSLAFFFFFLLWAYIKSFIVIA